MPGLCDSYAARKTPGMLHELGFEDIAVEIERDKLFTVVGRIGDEARRNLDAQWEAAFPYVAKIWGQRERPPDMWIACSVISAERIHSAPARFIS